MKERLGTLGEGNGFLTCSMYIAEKRHKYAEIVPYQTFEEAAFDLKMNKISSMLVPVAYPKISEFIMDNELMAEEVFIEQIPPLVCVGKDSHIDIKAVNKIYLHQATYKLLDDLGVTCQEIELCFVNSNIEACKCLFRSDGKNSIAVTNKLCADFYTLNIISTLRSGVLMPWVSFVKMGRDA